MFITTCMFSDGRIMLNWKTSFPGPATEPEKLARQYTWKGRRFLFVSTLSSIDYPLLIIIQEFSVHPRVLCQQ